MSLQAAIKKRFSGFSLDVSLNTNGGVMGILGASGSGKSMTLKCIAGIETPDEGRIVLNGRVLFDSEKHINPAAAEAESWLFIPKLCIVSEYDRRNQHCSGAFGQQGGKTGGSCPHDPSL